LFPVQNTRLNKIALTYVPSLLSSILKTPQDDDKVRCVKKLKIYSKPCPKKTGKKNRKKKLRKKLNSKIQLENPTRNPNPVNRQPLFNLSMIC